MDTNRRYNILVIGGGGRESALCMKIAQSENCAALYCAPGNAGTAAIAENVPELNVKDNEAVSEWCATYGIDLVVIGPEDPLVSGMADRLRKDGVLVFGPNSDGAMLVEGSKWAAKQLMVANGIPTAEAQVFTECQPALTYVRTKYAAGKRVVVKADGLAAGKGVIVPQTQAEAETAVQEILGGKFGKAGLKVVIEEFLEGREFSVMAIVAGNKVVVLDPAQDYKRLSNDDIGPNTGGMGSFSPVPFVTDEMMQEVMTHIIGPFYRALSKKTDYRGVLYAGLMLCSDGKIRVIEWNCRWGDPETQAILQRLMSDLLPMLYLAAEGEMRQLEEIDWSNEAAVCVVMAAYGYPGTPRKGDVIRGIEKANQVPGVTVLHAGTSGDEDHFRTAGGRVISVVATGATLLDARERVYTAVGAIDFPDAQYRTDIATGVE